jgi:L-Lysine epsilon oxidase N-terminal/L-lysine epsilon oxidase C-terminal domain
MASVCRTGVNTIAAPTRFRIHPGIGIARVGNHPDQFFVGPEVPGVSASPPGGAFKVSGMIRRQGARFRIFDYGDISPTGLANCEPRAIDIKDPQVESITWTVEVANRKASFFAFDGLAGDSSPFSPTPRPFEARRNAGNTSFEITPAPQSIIMNKTTRPPAGFSFIPGPKLTNTNAAIPIPLLGELWMDTDGNLVFLGGFGKSASNRSPAPVLTTYANNDTWFDDVCDGIVRAKVKLKSGREITCDPAWVVVGPPDFAPALRNVITLYDVLWDVAVRLLPALPPDNPLYDKGLKRLKDQKTAMGTYKPSYQRDIHPALQAAIDTRWVYKPAAGSHGGTVGGDLFNPDPAKDSIRQMVVGFLRVPTGETPLAGGGVHSMPKLLGDEPYTPVHPRYRATVTATQYTILKKFAGRDFVDDHGSPRANAISPEGLDEAALENCVGAAMYPGIEMSWLSRNPAIYQEPFRIKPGASIAIKFKDAGGVVHSGTLVVRPGFFSQQMALPWQADFADCHRETANSPGAPDSGQEFGWWPGQRPDEVPGSPMKPWARRTTGNWPAPGTGDGYPGHEGMVVNWSKFGFVKTSDGGRTFSEDEVNPAIP